jgi:CDP-diglyceride synthetase
MSWLDMTLATVFAVTAIMFLMSFWTALPSAYLGNLEDDKFSKVILAAALTIPTSGVSAYLFVRQSPFGVAQGFGPMIALVSGVLFVFLLGNAFRKHITNWGNPNKDYVGVIETICATSCAIIALILIHATR